MYFDPKQVATRYAAMSDEQLTQLRREDLTPEAVKIYDLELARRGDLANPPTASTRTIPAETPSFFVGGGLVKKRIVARLFDMLTMGFLALFTVFLPIALLPGSPDDLRPILEHHRVEIGLAMNAGMILMLCTLETLFTWRWGATPGKFLLGLR